MKKQIAVMVCVLALCAGGCGEARTIGSGSAQESTGETAALGAETAAQTATAGETAGSEQAAGDGYFFMAGNVKLAPDMYMDGLLEQLGDGYSYYEEESCAAQGTARFYTYSDYEIDTYPEGDKDRILYIILKTDNVKTPEGADLSMTKDQIISLYGDAYTEEGRQISYNKGNMRLAFIFHEDGSLASIEYDSLITG